MFGFLAPLASSLFLGGGGTALASSAVASIAGKAVSGLLSREEADKNRDFQAAMSNTAYQRAMADMRKAGLNPILAAKLGGASTPGGAMATIPDFGDAINTAYANQTQRMQTEANIGKIEQEVENLGAQLELTEEQTRAVKATIEKTLEEVQYVKARTGMTNALAALPKLVEKFLSESDAVGAVSNTAKRLGKWNPVDSAKGAVENQLGVSDEVFQELKRRIIIIIKDAGGLQNYQE